MIEREELWRRVQEALDRRADPLDEPELAAWLGESPQELERYAELACALEVVAAPETPPARARPRRWPWLVTAAAAASIAAWLWPDAAPAIAFVPPESVGIEIVRVRVEQTGSERAGVVVFEWDGQVVRQATRAAPSQDGEVIVHRLQVASAMTTRVRGP
jgi:hypothetical protein